MNTKILPSSLRQEGVTFQIQNKLFWTPTGLSVVSLTTDKLHLVITELNLATMQKPPSELDCCNGLTRDARRRAKHPQEVPFLEKAGVAAGGSFFSELPICCLFVSNRDIIKPTGSRELLSRVQTRSSGPRVRPRRDERVPSGPPAFQQRSAREGEAGRATPTPHAPRHDEPPHSPFRWSWSSGLFFSSRWICTGPAPPPPPGRTRWRSLPRPPSPPPLDPWTWPPLPRGSRRGRWMATGLRNAGRWTSPDAPPLLHEPRPQGGPTHEGLAAGSWREQQELACAGRQGGEEGLLRTWVRGTAQGQKRGTELNFSLC